MEKLFENIFNPYNNFVRTSPTAQRYVLNVEKKDGYCRFDLPFFNIDPTHQYLITHGEKVAFPPRDDFPSNDLYSFDVYYFQSTDKEYHRITLSRAHTKIRAFFVCFVDGNVIWAAQQGARKSILINKDDYQSNFESFSPFRFSFYLGHTLLYIFANSGFTPNDNWWKRVLTKSPHHYGIFINNRCTTTGNTIEEEENNGGCCPVALVFVISFPVWLVWMLGAGMVSLCMSVARKCTVRRYRLVEERTGRWKQREIKEGERDWYGANETTSLVTKQTFD